jgi:hypothetical protein
LNDVGLINDVRIVGEVDVLDVAKTERLQICDDPVAEEVVAKVEAVENAELVGRIEGGELVAAEVDDGGGHNIIVDEIRETVVTEVEVSEAVEGVECKVGELRATDVELEQLVELLIAREDAEVGEAEGQRDEIREAVVAEGTQRWVVFEGEGCQTVNGMVAEVGDVIGVEPELLQSPLYGLVAKGRQVIAAEEQNAKRSKLVAVVCGEVGEVVLAKVQLAQHWQLVAGEGGESVGVELQQSQLGEVIVGETGDVGVPKLQLLQRVGAEVVRRTDGVIVVAGALQHRIYL